MKIVFRVDASKELGIGHLMRCLALSEELVRKGNVCFFLSKIDNDELKNRIKKFDVNYQQIKNNANIQEDLKFLINFSKINDIDWIITDHYGIDSQYIREIKQNKFNVLSVDDTAQIHYYSDIVLNQNVGTERLKFSSEKYTKFLLGIKYAILRDELLKREGKIENNEVKKILLTFGGSETDNFILKILRVLEPINENVEFLVVVGPFSQSYNNIKEHAKETSLEVKLIKSPENMAEVYLESDIAVSAGGSSCYELAYFGIPNLIITIADNQVNIAHELDKQKVSIYLGRKDEIKADQLKNSLKDLIASHSLRKIMRQNGRKLVDGKGKERIVDFMRRFN